ncbi:MAG: PAS domain S-box protein, partial [Deltaproteobacteria bacterium]|nr:PAS domain S-box protein [Deltaproteobacteria bacterium]
MSTHGNSQPFSSAKAYSRTASAGLILLAGLVLLGWTLNIPTLEVVLMVAGTSLLFVVLVWLNAATLNRLDRERQRREEALRESEDRYRRLVETAKDVIFTVSTDGTFTSLNPAFETVTDWSRTEWLEKSFVPFVYPDDRPRALEIFHQLLQGETPPLSELRVLFRSGAVHTWEFTATPQFREGTVASILVIVRDVSARRQMEEALRESEIRLRTIFENAAIGIGLSNLEGRLVRSNPALQEMLGYSEEELRGMVFTEFTYPEDREVDWDLFQELMANKREYYQREKRYIRKDGGLIWIRLTVSLIEGARGEPQFAVGMVEDITARKQAEEVLRHREEYFRALIENASDIMSILNADGTVQYQGPSGERVLGYTMEELAGQNAFAFVHPEDLEQLLQTFVQGIEIPDHIVTMEFRFRHKDGSWRYLEGIGKNLLANPAVAGIVVNSRDVTERKRAEQALRESEERFRLLSASSPVGIFSNDVAGACLYTNSRWQEIAGMTAEESLGNGWLIAIAPEDTEKVLAEWQACVSAGRKFSHEFRFRHPNGETRWVRAQATVLQSDSHTPLGYVGTVEDITERRQAEAELEQLRHQQELILQSVADGIYVLDRQRKAIFVNPAAARIVGYSPEELLGHSMHDLLHHSRSDGTPYPRTECPIEVTFTDGTLHQVANEVFWCKDGTSFPVEYTSAPMRENGQIAGVVVAFRDISERRAVERMKDEFISVVSHELRTPLTSIRGALGLLSSGLVGALPDKGQRMLEIAVNNTDRLVRLINDILDIERMQSGKVLMQYRLCDAAAVLSQASDEMRALADKAEVTLAVGAAPLRLWADPDRLVQTLTNLLSNALKFSPPQTTVHLQVQRQGEEAVFTVQDQGRGIPADKLESIFERFQQVDASDSRQKGGTGLGLA